VGKSRHRTLQKAPRKPAGDRKPLIHAKKCCRYIQLIEVLKRRKSIKCFFNYQTKKNMAKSFFEVLYCLKGNIFMNRHKLNRHCGLDPQ
jgi:hypothetical protein